MSVEWTPGAVNDFDDLDPQVAERVLKRVSWLARNDSRIVPESLSSAFKLRVGDWSVVYTELPV